MIYLKALFLFWKSEQKTKDKIKAIYWFAYYYSWISQLDSRLTKADMNYITQLHPYIFHMVRLRSYVVKNSTKDFILDRVAGHYEAVKGLISPQEMKSIFTGGLPIWSSEINDLQIEVNLIYVHRMRNEGQLSLQLTTNGEDAYYIHFHLYEDAIWVAGIQGIRGNLDLNRLLTKVTNGLRPQNLIYFALTALAARFNCKAIYGINSEYHYYQAEDNFEKKVDFNYNTFWQELGGEAKDDAWFALPVDYQRKNTDEIVSKKRAQYRKRYQLMDEMKDVITSGSLKK